MKPNRFDLGLAILAATSTPPHTCDTIAAYCGCTRQNVSRIELRVLRKIRAYLYRNPNIDQALKAEFEAMCRAHDPYYAMPCSHHTSNLHPKT